MLNLNSAVERDETPHTINSTQTNGLKVNGCIPVVLRRRAESVINDRSIDARSRAVIRYALETNDPWLVELVRRVVARESLFGSTGLSQARPANEDLPTDFNEDLPIEEKVEALADIICSSGADPATRSAALLVLIAGIETSPLPKALANVAKCHAFNRCVELNVCGMVESQIAVFETELFAGNTLAA